MKKPIKIIITIILFLIFLNASFWILSALKIEPIYSLYKEGMIIKIKPLNYAMIFAHGVYLNLSNTSFHATYYQNNWFPTEYMIQSLKEEGYDNIWLSQCQTGNHNYIIKFPSGNEVPWEDYVSRKERKGNTIPVFIGFGFIRL